MAWHESFRTSCLNSGGQWHNSTRSIAYALHIMGAHNPSASIGIRARLYATGENPPQCGLLSFIVEIAQVLPTITDTRGVAGDGNTGGLSMP
jgi:hypothetical protein